MKRQRDDRGFTLIELVITIAIMGVIIVPLGNFVISYFTNLAQTQARLSGSHDVQIAAAYFSRDVADMSQLMTPGASTCGSDRGTTLLLISTDDWTVAGNSGTDNVHDIGYVVESGTLHRVYCASGSTVSSDATLIHNYASATLACSPSACTGSPDRIVMTVSFTGSGDSQPVDFSGRRRRSS